MAVSFIQTPQNYELSGNDLLYTFLSDQWQQPNFSYFVTIRYNSQNVSFKRIFAQATGVGQINVSDFVDAILPVYENDKTQLMQILPFNVLEIRVQEEFGDPPTFGASATPSVINILKGATELSFGYNSQKYIVDAIITPLFLSKKYKQSIGGSVAIIVDVLPILNNNFDVEIIDKNEIKINSINLGYNSIGLLFLSITNQTLLTIFTQQEVDITEKVEVTVFGDTSTSKYIFEKQDPCYFDNTVTYFNSFGVEEAIKVNQNEDVNYKVDATIYKKQRGSFIGNDFVINQNTVGSRTVRVGSQKEVEVSTKYLPKKEVAILRDEINNSPLIKLNGIPFIPNSSYKMPNLFDDKLENITLKGIIEAERRGYLV